MFWRWLGSAVLFVWGFLLGPVLGFAAGQWVIGADCRLSPAVVADTQAAVTHTADVLASALKSNSEGGRMSLDPVSWLPWLILPALVLAALVVWLRSRTRPSAEPELSVVVEPAPSRQAPRLHWGRDYKLAVGSAGIKSLVREARMEEGYEIRAASETAFEACADFDQQQERIAVVNRPQGPGFLVLSDTLDAQSPLREGLGNRTPADVWTMREEWMPSVSHFVNESALQLRATGVWPARITAHLSAGGHGMPGLYALSEVADEFPRADRHAHFIVPEGDVERFEALRLLARCGRAN
jgi:hypothetical protein